MRRPKAVVAPNAFKGSLSAAQAADVMAKAVRAEWPGASVERVPIADGGDGSMDAVASGTQGFRRAFVSVDPLGRPLRAPVFFFQEGGSAFIETARTSGFALLDKKERNPCRTSTAGVGILLKKAIGKGARDVYVGLGGSATNDGGAGAAAAAGYRFFDRRGKEFFPNGGNLARLARVEPPENRFWEGARICGACDVTNPFAGPTGATRVFSRQKGATARQADRLEKNLRLLARIMLRDLRVDVNEIPGAGAAGGLGGGIAAFFGGRLIPGFEMMAAVSGLEKKMKGAALILTGEGRMDGQTLFGKGPKGILDAAAGVPVYAVCGQIRDRARLLRAGFSGLFALDDRGAAEAECMRNARNLLLDRTREAVRAFRSQTAPRRGKAAKSGPGIV